MFKEQKLRHDDAYNLYFKLSKYLIDRLGSVKWKTKSDTTYYDEPVSFDLFCHYYNITLTDY